MSEEIKNKTILGFLARNLSKKAFPDSTWDYLLHYFESHRTEIFSPKKLERLISQNSAKPLDNRIVIDDYIRYSIQKMYCSNGELSEADCKSIAPGSKQLAHFWKTLKKDSSETEVIENFHRAIIPEEFILN